MWNHRRRRESAARRHAGVPELLSVDAHTGVYVWFIHSPLVSRRRPSVHMALRGECVPFCSQEFVTDYRRLSATEQGITWARNDTKTAAQYCLSTIMNSGTQEPKEDRLSRHSMSSERRTSRPLYKSGMPRRLVSPCMRHQDEWFPRNSKLILAYHEGFHLACDFVS